MRTSTAALISAGIASVVVGGAAVGATVLAYEVVVVPRAAEQIDEGYRVIGNLLDIQAACQEALNAERDRSSAFLDAGAEQRQAIDNFFTAGTLEAGDAGYLYDQFLVSDAAVLRASERSASEESAGEDCFANPFG